jgi:hypothetical protein
MKLSNPETPYVLSKVDEWAELYESGMAVPDMAKKYSVHKSTIYNRLKQNKVKIRSKSTVKLGTLNPMWKAETITNTALHSWVRNRLLRPDLCPSCNLRLPYDLANISNTYNRETYTRDLKNWEWLCRRCHMVKDGRITRLYHGGANPKHIGCNVPKCNLNHEGKGLCKKHYQSYRYNKKVGKNDHPIMLYVSPAN